MSEKDQVFCFVEGPWARTKLYSEKVKDLASALAAAERVGDVSGDPWSQKMCRHRIPGRGQPNLPSHFGNEKKAQTPSTGTRRYQSSSSRCPPSYVRAPTEDIGPRWQRYKPQCSILSEAEREVEKEDEGSTERLWNSETGRPNPCLSTG